MPSGSKKRKAAKKKKSQHHTHNNNNNNSTHENDEHKSQDERDTDGGEVSSPFHVQVHPFDDGNSGSDLSPDQSPVAQNESAFAKEEFVLKEELKDDTKIEEEVIKSEGDNWDVEEVGIELVHSAKEVNANDGTPNNSSLDNVPIGEKSVEKAIDCESETTSYVNETTEVTTKDTESEALAQTDDNLIVEPLSVVDELNSVVVPLSEEVVEVLESASVENSAVFDVAGSALNGNAEKLTDDDIEILQAAMTNVEASEKNENKVSLSSNENNAVPVFEVVETASVENSAVFNENAEKLLPATDDIEILQAPATNVEASENNENKVSLSSIENNENKVSLSSIENNAVPVFESASVENSTVFDAAGSVLKGNAEKLSDGDIEILQAATTNVEAIDNSENKVSLLSKEIVGASLEKEGLKLPDALSDIMDVAPKEIKVKTFPVLEETIVGVSSNLGESAISGVESTALMMSSEASGAAVTSHGTENIKNSETEPLVAPAPQVVRKSSWLNCCGIFDMLSGSSR